MTIRLRIYLIFILSTIHIWLFADDTKLKFSHYTNEDGLPSSYIKSISQDNLGFIWAATRSSVCRFDGNHFKTFQAIDSKGNMFDIWGKDIIKHQDSLLIIQDINNKFFVLNSELEQFESYDLINNIDGVTAAYESDDGFWLVKNDTLLHLNMLTRKIEDWKQYFDFAAQYDNYIIYILDEYDKYFAGISNSNTILVIDKEQRLDREFELPEEMGSKNISVLFVDSYHYAWIGIYDYGLWRVNLTNGKTTHFSSKGNGNQFLLHDLVHSIEEDNSGRIWIGTENGLCVWSPYTETFDFYKHNINNPDGLNTNPIYDLFCDNQGNMWMGTYFGGINFWSNNTAFFNVWRAGNSDQHISGNAVSCIAEDDNGDIWIGMEDMGINRIDSKTGLITYRINENNGLSFNNVHHIFFQDKNKMWISTYTGGINIFNLRSKTFEYINQTNHPRLPSNNIYHILQCGDSMYISTSAGVVIYDLNSKSILPFHDGYFDGVQVEYMYKGKDKIWLSSLSGIFSHNLKNNEIQQITEFEHLKNVNFVRPDSKGRIWVGDCLQGLWGYDPTTDSIYCFNQNTGFPFSWIFSLEESNNGDLWISGDKGLVRLKPNTKEHVWFNRESGIPFEQFNFRASYKDKKGNIFFGGNSGMISFNERVRQEEPKALNVVFRGMQLFNQEIIPGTHSVIKKSLNQHPEIHLKYKENVFTIEYAGLHFQNRGICQYAYYLENFEYDWNYVGTRDFATYTNISPGEYFFHVKASTDKEIWGNTDNVLKIIVEPPFWLSRKGYAIYALLVVLVLLTIFFVTIRIQKSKAMVEMERREREYSAELNNFKLEFFTNVSHELRTPLTLIVGPLSNILEEESLSPMLVKKMKGIKNNAHRLLILINQLLEFRKIEKGKERLRVSHQDITILLRGIEESFAELASSKGVSLSFESKNILGNIWIDCQKIENIIVNIISNALKYTKEGDSVKCFTKVVEKKNPAQKLLKIKISDTGVGIEPAKLNRIFDRFYSDTSNSSSDSGSGIGLAFVNSLVKLHKGDINVKSDIGKGTVFTVTIPVRRKDYEDNEIIFSDGQYVIEVEPVDEKESIPSLNKELDRLKEKPVLLVIDDNEELLEFISETLADSYSVITAIDGDKGLTKIREKMPDLIISDVMMPGIDGFELTQIIKSDIHTSHIPVLLLTAKTGEENEYEGLKTGADYYIEKPFLPHILKKLIQNILKTRRSLIEHFKSDVNFVPSEIAYSEYDKKLIDKLTRLILENINNTKLDVSYLVNEVGISRSLLHLKLKKLTDCSATEFIRSIRLREAAKLIAEGKCNISEAAYQTGFSSPAYFSSRFKEYFGVSPKAYFQKK